MYGQSLCNFGDPIHQLGTHPLTLFCDVGGGLELDGFAEADLFQSGSEIHGHKGNSLSGAPVIQLCHIHKAFLKIVDDMIMRLIILRENNDVLIFIQRSQRLLQSRAQACVTIDGDGVGVVEDADRQRCDDIGHDLKKPADIFWLVAPES